MGFDQGHEKSQSVQSSPKGSSKIFAAGLILLSFGCSSTPSDPVISTAAPVVVAKKLDLTSLGFQLTEVGSNQMPSVSEDESQIVFISSDRRSHKQGQVYIYDLNNLTERRVTFQDGECQDPVLLKNGKRLVYSSNTDELKENPLLFEKSLASPEAKEQAAKMAMELYSSDLSGAEIQRMTSRKGYDGEAWQRPDRPQSLIYSVQEKGRMQAWQINTEQGGNVLLLQKKEASIYSLRPSPSVQKWAWIERNNEEASNIYLSTGRIPGTKEEKIVLPAGDYRDLGWLNEDRLFFSAKISIQADKPSKYYQIYSYHIANHCLEKLFESNSHLKSPQLMKKNQSLVFISDLSGSFQIYNKALPVPGQCLQF